jgi:hypothetical protein
VIRRAEFTDVRRCAEIVAEAHERSVYVRRSEIDVKEVKRLLVQAIQRHGAKQEGGTWVMVADHDGQVEAFIIGTLSRLYHIYTDLMATDLLWIASPRVHPRDPARLMGSMIEWAESCPGVVEIQCAVSGAVGDWTRTEKLLQRRGMEHYGAIYRKSLR